MTAKTGQYPYPNIQLLGEETRAFRRWLKEYRRKEYEAQKKLEEWEHKIYLDLSPADVPF